MKYHILFNPISGTGNGKSDAEALSKLYGGETVIHNITEINDYKELFRSFDQDDKLILCGGDGTLNRFINDTDGIDIDFDLLYYAGGSGNDFAHDVDKKKGDEPFLINEYIKGLPTVTVKGKTYRFLNNVGFGIDGYCCEVGDKQKETSDKPVNYTSIAIKGLLFHFAPTNATIEVDGKEYKYKKVWLAPTMKGRYYGGGMMATPRQDRKDPEGKLSVMVFYGGGRLRTLMAFPSIFKGEHIKYDKMVKIHEGKEITVTFDRPTALQIDGETILGVTSYKAAASVAVRV